jgi:hypothetical protein
MLHYALLTVCTLLIFYLCIRIWKKTREVAFLLGIALIYYWSLLGSWFIIFDSLTDNAGKEFGLHYYHLFERLFLLKVDGYYDLVMLLYTLFIVVVQVCILLLAGKNDSDEAPAPFRINHHLLILMCIGAAIVSFSLVWKEILTAAKFNESIYVVTRHQPGKLFTIHQLLNEGAIVALYIGFIACISGAEGRFIKGDRSVKTIAFYAFGIFFVEAYLLLLGNKREIMFGGILAFLFYLYNLNYRISYKWVIAFMIVLALPLFFNDGLRTFSPTFLTKYFDTSGLEYNPKEEINYTTFTMKNATFTFLFSNEMFASHFSMYGVLAKDVPYTYGSSIVSFAASMVPGVLWPDRPPGIYHYYISQTSEAKAMQGFTIHHATGWYLNFGVLGLIMGGVVLGCFWTFLYNRFRLLVNQKKLFFRVFFTIAIAAFTAQIPTLIRSGPEGYKALIFEALFLPALILFIAAKLVRKKKT